MLEDVIGAGEASGLLGIEHKKQNIGACSHGV
jgi:hypothetical protein